MNRNSISSSVLLSIASAASISLSPFLGASSAQALSAVSFPISNNFSSPYTDFTLGYSFDVTSPITVTHLGVFDHQADGLVQSHEVGLWDPAGNLIASTTVPSGTVAALDANNLFRIVPITNTPLAVGNGYIVGAVFLQGSPDSNAFRLPSEVTTPAQITFVSGTYNFGSTLTRPASSDTLLSAGGSFEFTPTPVPFAFNPIFGVGVFGLSQARRAWKRRNEKRQVNRAET